MKLANVKDSYQLSNKQGIQEKNGQKSDTEESSAGKAIRVNTAQNHVLARLCNAIMKAIGLSRNRNRKLISCSCEQLK